MATLTLIRGVPGSGKSTLALALAKETKAFFIEADMFFTAPNGDYNYKKEKIREAHSWCMDYAFFELEKGKSVIVSNTFVRLWEMMPYALYAHDKKHSLQIITCTGNFQNLHRVPPEIVEKMKANFEWDHSILFKPTELSGDRHV